MKTIGLIGGMSWESTATYYKQINEGIRAARGDLASASLLLHSLDFSQVVALQKADDWQGAAKLLGGAARGLSRAGAECILICTNTMHLVSREVEHAARVPLIDIISETAGALKAAQRKRPLLLGTRYTMEHGFYAQRMADHGIELMVPNALEDRHAVHGIIFDELCQGKVLECSRARYIDVISKARDLGADSVILGCTEIGLLIDPDHLPLPGFDSTRIHAAAAVRFALETGIAQAA